MSCVIDGSVAVAWVLEDEQTPEALEIRDRVARDGATVPWLWWWEVGNVMLMAERRKRITREERRASLADLRRFAVVTDALPADRAWDQTSALAEQHRVTVYDAAYLELALRSGLPLASLDTDLNAAAVRSGVEALLA